KTILFYVALVPTLIDIGNISLLDYALLLTTTFLVLIVVLVPYMLLASRARTMLKQPRALQEMKAAVPARMPAATRFSAC
ncbi:LysE family translocator, partial [Rhizobium ruizarguesonis]